MPLLSFFALFFGGCTSVLPNRLLGATSFHISSLQYFIEMRHIFLHFLIHSVYLFLLLFDYVPLFLLLVLSSFELWACHAWPVMLVPPMFGWQTIWRNKTGVGAKAAVPLGRVSWS